MEGSRAFVASNKTNNISVIDMQDIVEITRYRREFTPMGWHIQLSEDGQPPHRRPGTDIIPA